LFYNDDTFEQAGQLLIAGGHDPAGHIHKTILTLSPQPG
jgi:hypothetical protein